MAIMNIIMIIPNTVYFWLQIFYQYNSYYCYCILFSLSSQFVQGQTEGRTAGQWGDGSHCDEALVAIVDTQCCWKLGDMAALQPSLWRGPFRPPSPSTIQGLLSDSLPSMPQHSWDGAQLRSPAPKAGSWPGGGGAEGALEEWSWKTLMMWFKRSLKNSGTPSYPGKSKNKLKCVVMKMILECRLVSENILRKKNWSVQWIHFSK